MAQRAPFPSDAEEFDSDERISYDKTAQTYILEDENGEEWEWLPGPSKWSQTMDENLMKQQAEIYKVAGVDDDAPAFDPAKKRKAAQQEDLESNKRAKAESGAKAKPDAIASATPRRSTAVFVSGLPLDVDTEEVREVFKKYGMLAESADTDEKRVKLYNDKDGNFKGEALIVYFRPESVQMAVDMMDGYEFPRDPDLGPSGIISVVEADSSYKKHKDDTVAQDRGSKPKPSKARTKAKAEEMNSRLADWDDDEPSTMRQTSSRYDKVVVLKHVFTFDMLAKEKNILNDIKEDMQEGGAEHGEVKNVTIFDLEEDGVVTVRFSNAMAAESFARECDGRIYDGQRLEASIATGNEKFKKSRKEEKDKDADEAKRLEEYSKYIEGKADANGNEES